MTAAPARRTRHILLIVALALAALLIMQRLEAGGQIDRAVNYFRAAGAAPFFVAMALLPAIGFPIWPLTVVAGHVFGPTLGVATVIACAILAEMANMALCYWLAARVLHGWAQRFAARLGYVWPEIPTGSAWEITFLVRIVPGPPFFLQSYLLGFARVPFGIYLLVSTLVHALFVVGTILAGDALARHDPRTLAIAIGVCAAAGVAVYRLRRHWRR